MSEIKEQRKKEEAWKFAFEGNKYFPDNFIDFCASEDGKALKEFMSGKKDFIELHIDNMDAYEKVGGFYHDDHDGDPIKTGYIPVEYNRYKKLIKMEEIFCSPDHVIIDKDIFDELKAKAKKYDQIKEVLS